MGRKLPTTSQRLLVYQCQRDLGSLQGADLQQGELDLEKAQRDEPKRNRARLTMSMSAINGPRQGDVGVR